MRMIAVVCLVACGDGTAAPQVEVLASGQAKPWGLMSRGDSVYWTNLVDGGDVVSVAKRGGTAQVLAAAQPSPARLVVDATNVYFSTAESGTVRSVAIGGGATIEIAAGGVRPARVAVDATHVYWTDEQAPGVYRAPIGGGTTMALATTETDTPTGLAIFEQWVYFGDAGNSHVSRVMKDGTGLQVVADVEVLVQDLASDGAAVYWVTGGGTVRRWEAATQSVSTIAEGLRLPRGLAVDTDAIYVTTFIGNEVIRISASGEQKVIANDECAPFGIAIDESHVYWAASDCGEVRAIAKN